RRVDLVAPADGGLQLLEVVAGPGGADGEEGDARVEVGLGLVEAGPGHRAFDAFRVGADLGGVLGEDDVLACQGVEIGEAVPDVGVFGDQAQSLLLTAAADEDRYAADGLGVELAEAGGDAGQVFLQQRQTGSGGAEFVAVLVVVLLEPAGADAEDQAAAADVVDGAGHVGEQVGVAVAAAGDPRADLGALGLLGEGAEHGPALEVRALGVAAERVEVIPVEDDVG